MLAREQKEKSIKIYIFGSQDEMMDLVQTILHEEQIEYDVIFPFEQDMNDLGFHPAEGVAYTIFCWSKEAVDILKNYQYINILI